MASKNIPESSRGKPAPAGKAPKSQGEIEAKDLDKVTGGVRPSTIGRKGELTE